MASIRDRSLEDTILTDFLPSMRNLFNNMIQTAPSDNMDDNVAYQVYMEWISRILYALEEANYSIYMTLINTLNPDEVSAATKKEFIIQNQSVFGIAAIFTGNQKIDGKRAYIHEFNIHGPAYGYSRQAADIKSAT